MAMFRWMLLTTTTTTTMMTMMTTMMTMMMIVAVIVGNEVDAEEKPRKICRGTNSGLSHTGSTMNRLSDYKQRYENCTVVNGNLEIVFLATNSDIDLSFLRDIREVTGYVLIYSNTVTDLHLDSLRIIRGSTQTNCKLPPPNDVLNCSLLVSLNFHMNYQEFSLTRLGLVSLQDILAGHVNIADNRHLCYSESILWKDIFSSPNSRAFTDRNKECTEECHESCDHNGSKYCWGEGPEMCQKMTKVICSPQCDNRCSGQTPDLCCHKECAVGCTGPSTTDCLACGHFENDGKCEEHCPPVTTYDPQTLMQVNNPGGRFTYGSVCLKKCPAHLSTDNGACVKQCSPGHHIVNGNCVLCSGPCPKSCPGTNEMGITTSNIDRLRDCKVINGNLLILGTAFDGDIVNGIKPLTLDQLDILESIEEITGSLSVQLLRGGHVRNLAFLRNLRIIRGIELTGDLKSLKIVSTDLESLSLHSLTEIGYGNVLISRNPKLCFVDSIDWNHLFRDADSTVVIKENNLTCGGLTCSSQCSELGCWGPEDTECLSCRNFKFKDKCLETCEMDPPIYAKDNRTCERCHPECTESCTGESASQCSSCLNVRDDQTCLPSCPPGKFPDDAKTCLPCHENCGNHGCTGPFNIVGEGGCNSCDLVLFGDLSDRSKVTECINPKLNQCAEGFYKMGLHEFPENHTLHMKFGCRRCHPECVTCDDYGTNYCGQCRHYLQEDKCVPSCSTGFFPPSLSLHALSMEKRSDNKSHRPLSRQGKVNEATCRPCDPSCLTCYGPKSSDCYNCRNYRIYHDEVHPDKGFNCTTKCPESAPFKVTKEDNGTKITVCVVDDTSGQKAMLKVVVPVVVLLVILIAVTILVVVVFNFKKAKRKSKMLTAAASLLVGDPLPIDPSGIAGDESRVGTISKKELRLGDKIGSGAFGSVYKGIWSPPTITCRIYVAIKVAHDCFGAQTNEVLDEVRVMSGVVHENCIRILGLCLAERIMIITQLMPYGCMLDFIKDNKENIGSKVLLNWAMQIAKGMEYLESKHIVHRDLAARNVLVQNDNHVRITDFGLSKILHGRDHYQSEGGKLPIKWLALESLQSKLFTHKSDVWSYGVTLWEMFTFGKKPYEHVDPCNMLDFLEKGDRLIQPSICTIDVYMVMIKCWIPHAADRPTFHQLVETFGVMARDPVRFLVIKNDESKELKSTEPLTLLRQLSTIDDEKPVMEIEEYLQKSSEGRMGQEVNSGSSKVSPGSSTRVDTDEPSRPHVHLGVSHKKANGHALYHAKPGKTSFKESPNKSRYIDDPCDKSDQRLLQRPTNLPPTILERLPSTREFDPSPGANDQDYLEPEKTPNGYLGHRSPQQSHPLFSAFSNPQYFDLPHPDFMISNDDGAGTPVVSNGPSVKFSNKDGEAVVSLVGRNSEPSNEVFEEEPGPASRLLGSIKDNNNEYYNDFLRATRKPKNNSSTLLGV